MQLNFRFANIRDANLYFEWANDELVREFSYSKANITYADHVAWFTKELASGMTFFYLFENEMNIPVGQVRIQMKLNNIAVIGVSIAKDNRGRGYGSRLIKIASDNFLFTHPDQTIHAYIIKENKSSLKAFMKAGFILLSESIGDGMLSNVLYKDKPC